MFCISSQICCFNSGVLLNTLLLRYLQRKKSIGDKYGLWVGQLMSSLSDTEHNDSEVWHVAPCWFLYSCKCKSFCRMWFKDFLSTFKMLDCFRVENSSCSRTDAFTCSTFSGSSDVLSRPDSGWFIVKPVSLKFCTHCLINWIDGASFLCSML